MDEISKENVSNLEGQPDPDIGPSHSDVETEALPESLSLETSESGEQPTSAPVQVVDDSPNQPKGYTEEEIQEETDKIASLTEGDKLFHLKEVAQKNSLEKAIHMVKKMNDPWLEDKFHDELMDDPEWRRLLETLGKIEKL